MTLEAARPKHRYVALDSLRGVCACMVVLLHFVTQGAIHTAPVVKHGFMFVDFFFVLSGFVIGSSYGDRLVEGFPIRRFMWLRLGRVYPLHVVMLLAFLAFEIVFAVFMPGLANRQPFQGNFSLATFFQSLSLVQIFLGPDAMPWNGPSWSIAAEIWTYLVFAVILRFGSRALGLLCLVIAVAAPIYLSQATGRYINVFHDGSFVRCLFGFALGMIGWRVSGAVQAIVLPKLADHLTEIAVVVATVVLVSVAGVGPLSLAAPFLFLVAVLVFSRERGLVSTLLRAAPFVLIGTLSYSIYMIHSFLYYRFLNVLSVLEKLTGADLIVSVDGHNIVNGPTLGDAMSLTFLGVVIGCSYLSYRLVEKPGQDWSRRMAQRRSAQPLPSTPGAP